MSSIKIGKKKIGFGQPIFYIAEAGVNHNGSMKLAKKLIDLASKSGADYVKFQSFKTELVFSKNTSKAPYQRKNTSNKTNAIEMAKKLELSERFEAPVDKIIGLL